MRKAVAALILAALTVSSAAPQLLPVRRYTEPRLPPAASLDRLNLTLAWSVLLHAEGTQDGLLSIQLLPGKADQLIVQTRRGLVTLIDAETGDLLWSVPVGRPFGPVHPVAVTEDDVYVVRGHTLYVLNRRTGRQRLYSVDRADGSVTYGFRLRAPLSAGPAADAERIYFCQDERVGAYEMPRFSATEELLTPTAPKGGVGAAPEGGPTGTGPQGATRAPVLPTPRDSTPQPEWAWGALTTGIPLGVPLPYPPVVIDGTVVFVGTEGTLIGMEKIPDEARKLSGPEERYRFKLFGPVAAPMGHLGKMLYVSSLDHRVYVIDGESGELAWRFLAGAPVKEQPWVTDRDVFVSAERRGLFRVDRESGEQVWLNKKAVRFLAANEKLAYATDEAGRLLVLDLARGRTLAECDLADYTVPFSNEHTDRVFLGAQDGSLVCLHHRDNRTPYRTRALPKPAPKQPPKTEKAPEKVEKKEPPAKEEEKNGEKEEKKAGGKEEKKADEKEDKKGGEKELNKGDEKEEKKGEPKVEPAKKPKDDDGGKKDADKTSRADTAWDLLAAALPGRWPEPGERRGGSPPVQGLWQDSASAGLRRGAGRESAAPGAGLLTPPIRLTEGLRAPGSLPPRLHSSSNSSSGSATGSPRWALRATASVNSM